MDDKFVNDRFPVEPISREELRGLKAKVEDIILKRKIRQAVDAIFQAVIFQAKNTEVPKFTVNENITNNFHSLLQNHKEEIILKLKELFPDSRIVFSETCPDLYGKWHDLSTLHPDILQYLDIKKKKGALIIDWS